MYSLLPGPDTADPATDKGRAQHSVPDWVCGTEGGAFPLSLRVLNAFIVIRDILLLHRNLESRLPVLGLYISSGKLTWNGIVELKSKHFSWY